MLWANTDWKSALLKVVGCLDQTFISQGSSPTYNSSCQKTGLGLILTRQYQWRNWRLCDYHGAQTSDNNVHESTSHACNAQQLTLNSQGDNYPKDGHSTPTERQRMGELHGWPAPHVMSTSCPINRGVQIGKVWCALVHRVWRKIHILRPHTQSSVCSEATSECYPLLIVQTCMIKC